MSTLLKEIENQISETLRGSNTGKLANKAKVSSIRARMELSKISWTHKGKE